MNGFRTPARGALMALLLVVLGGLALRLLGIGFLLPEMSEPDAAVYSAQVQYFQDGTIAAESDRQYTFYPFLVSVLAAGLQPPRTPETAARSLEEHLERASAPRERIRLTVALLSLLAIPAVWVLARRLVGPRFALVAAAFMAASFLALWFAQEARPHAASSAFAVWAVVAALALRARGGWRGLVAAGIAAGFALGSLQSGLAVLPPIAVALFLRWRAREERLASAWKGAGLVLAIVASMTAAFYPFLFERTPSGSIEKDASSLRLSGHIVDLTMFDGRGFATVARMAWQYEPVLTVLAALGILLGLQALWSGRRTISRAARDEVWIVLAYVVPYTLAIGLYARTYQRFVLPLVPFACVLAAYALSRAFQFARARHRLAAAMAVGVAAAAVCLQLLGAWSLSRARAAPSTVDLAARWIEEHVPADSRLAVLPMFEVPLLYSPAAFEANAFPQASSQYVWTRYLRELPSGRYDGRTWNLFAMDLIPPDVRDRVRMYPDPYMRELRADFVVLHVAGSPGRVLPRALRESAQRLGKLVARITPDEVDRGCDVEYVHQDDEFTATSSWFFRALGLARVGPIVEIYDLR